MRGKKLLGSFVLLVIIYNSMLVSGCVKNSNINSTTPTDTTISGLIATISNLTVLSSAVNAVDLDTLLSKPGPYTYFVATDAAYSGFGISSTTLTSLPDTQLRKILLYGLIPGKHLSTQFTIANNIPVQTYLGDSVFITSTGSSFFVNGFQLASYDFAATNGILDGVSAPLIPPSGNLLHTIQADTAFSYFAAAIARASTGTVNIDTLLSGSGIYTVFLATNSAFQTAGFTTLSVINNSNPDSLARIMEYNILPKRVFTSDFASGQTLTTLLTGNTIVGQQINGLQYEVEGHNSSASITSPNIMAYNGVIHVTNHILLP